MPTDAAAETSSRRRKKKRDRRIVLVESRRREATEAFLKEIEAAELRRSNGAREWVEVYDWRLLEAIAKDETQSHGGRNGTTAEERRAKTRELFRKFWIGLA